MEGLEEVVIALTRRQHPRMTATKSLEKAAAPLLEAAKKGLERLGDKAPSGHATTEIVKALALIGSGPDIPECFVKNRCRGDFDLSTLWRAVLLLLDRARGIPFSGDLVITSGNGRTLAKAYKWTKKNKVLKLIIDKGAILRYHYCDIDIYPGKSELNDLYITPKADFSVAWCINRINSGLN